MSGPLHIDVGHQVESELMAALRQSPTLSVEAQATDRVIAFLPLASPQ